MSFGLLPSALRYLGILLIVAASSALAAPTSAMGVLDYGDARHLLDRTGFGATEQEIRAYVGTTREAAVRKLLDGTRTSAVTPPPAWAGDNGPLRYPRRGEASDAIENKMFRQEQIRKGLELRSWWITEMLATPSPMTERMTLFWHNHFVSSQQKVKLAKLMYL